MGHNRAVTVVLSAFLALSGAVLPVAALAQAPAYSSQEEASLLAAEDGRFQAQIAKDMPAIAHGLADELIFTHSVGQVQNKTQYLDAISNGRLDFKSINVSDRTAWVSGDMGVTHAMLHQVVGTFKIEDSYLAAYIKRDGRWQLLCWQTSFGPNGPSIPPRPPAAH
ncbi:MAG TPA: nuclear transport factor 2 family protein [Caulobacteraceae bacterium]|nr:nuclear transport factor 2 family protein [Caulobacteraceae bacterium]